jgi:membrane fusion protein (multidrug efflux system)
MSEAEDTPQAATTNGAARKGLRLALVVVLPLLAVGGAMLWWMAGGRFVNTENAYVKADIVSVASEIAGRVEAVDVKNHASVRRGDILFRLDAEPYRIALAQADAEVDATRKQVAVLLAALKEARSELSEAETRAGLAESQLSRARALATRGIVASTRIEELEAEATQAASRVQVMQQRIARVLAQVGDPSRPVDDHPLVREKIAARDRATLDVNRTLVRAPVDGVAANLRLQQGEHVRAQAALFVLVADTRPWVEANFKETDLTHVRPGQTAEIILDIYPDLVWQARVDSISPATGAEFAVLPPQNASGNWVKVVQRLPVRLVLTPQGEEPPLRAGMTATVTIDTQRETRLDKVWRQVFGRPFGPPLERTAAR